MKAGYKIEHNHPGESLSETFPIAQICNYHNLNEIQIYYWGEKSSFSIHTVAVFRLKEKIIEPKILCNTLVKQGSHLKQNI